MSNYAARVGQSDLLEGGGMRTIIQRTLGPWIAALAITMGAPAQAQLSADKPTWDRCPAGPYNGPSSGLISHTADPYVWFVSKEFAQRFCMPQAMIDEQLKGALAIAARIEPNPNSMSCRRGRDGGSTCTTPDHLVLDVYVDNKTANIPKADPSVEFYVRRVESSTHVFSVGGARAERRRKGEITEAPGERPPFSLYGGPEVYDRRTRFLLLGVRQGWASQLGNFVESYYRKNWVEGIDVIRLQGALGYGGFPNPEIWRTLPKDTDPENPITSVSIGIIKHADLPKIGGFGTDGLRQLPYPKAYPHTIDLPMKLAQLLYAYDQKAGEAFFGGMRKRLESAPPPVTKP